MSGKGAGRFRGWPAPLPKSIPSHGSIGVYTMQDQTTTQATPRIYILITGRYGDGDVISTALAEDGHALAGHLSSSEGWAQHDMGLGGSTWKHDRYAEHYPDGYELVWVGTDLNVAGYPGLEQAYAAHTRLAEADKARGS